MTGNEEIRQCCGCCSAAQSCPTLCDPTDYSTPGPLVPHHLPKFAHVHVHCIGDATQPSHPLMPSSLCLQSFPALGTFLLSRLFASDDQNTGASASASVLPMSIQGWFPLRVTDLISLLSKGLSEIFSSTIVLRGKCSEKMTGNEEIRCIQRERDHGDE